MKKIMITLFFLTLVATAYAGIEEEYEQALSKLKAAKTETERFYALGPVAKTFFNAGYKVKAKELAEELQGLIQKYPDNWNYGNAIQDANIVFGRIAVSEGKIDDAKKYLLLAGSTPGSPQMNSFGPNMTLAKDLLEKGERDVVLQYFELCSKFWKMDWGKLKQWAKEVNMGQIPDFGPNLLY